MVINHLTFLLTTVVIYKNYYSAFVNAHVWHSPNSELRYFSRHAQQDIGNFFAESCYAGNDIILYDDNTYVPIQRYKGILASTSYTLLPFYQVDGVKKGSEEFVKFLHQYNNPVFLGCAASKLFFVICCTLSRG